MSAPHTPGRLYHDTTGYPRSDVREVGTNRNVANTWGTGGQPKNKEAYERRTATDRANARRLVACWNACDGISTEALERKDTVLDMAVREAREALKQRAELLAELQHAVRFYDQLNASDIDRYRAAIAKATGSASHG